MAAAVVPIRVGGGIVDIERERTTNSRRVVRAGTRKQAGTKPHSASYNPKIYITIYSVGLFHRGRDAPPPLRGSPSLKVTDKKGRSRRPKSRWRGHR